METTNWGWTSGKSFGSHVPGASGEFLRTSAYVLTCLETIEFQVFSSPTKPVRAGVLWDEWQHCFQELETFLA